MAEIENLIAMIPTVEVGDDPREVLTATRLNAIRDCLIALAQGSNLKAGLNLRKKSGGAWCMFSADNPKPQTQQRQRGHPFQVVPDTENTDGTQVKVKVSLDSWLMGSDDVDDKIAITGLDSGFSISANEYIYVKVVITEGEAGAATIEHGEQWEQYPSIVGYDDPEDPDKGQTFAYRLIAYTQGYPDATNSVTGDPEDFPDRLRMAQQSGGEPTYIQIVQCLQTNLIATDSCNDDGESVTKLEDYSMVPAPGA